ncbi:MAG TPA: 3-oxoacid CoA-transferase subunit B [Acidobacteriota bacterium]|nr:3-oxoacid CoA-transferase subunit B [Acidobacteriota bacterium]
MKDRLDRQTIALRVAKEFPDGAVVNLGAGIPVLAANFVPQGRMVIFHAENGVLGFGKVPENPEDERPYYLGANGVPFSAMPGMCFFHHADSFAMIRGGHIDITVLGALQVSEQGDLANWTFPERGIGNIGGAMDLTSGCARVIIAMEHVTPKGQLKILKACSYPLTAARCVNLIVTDIAVIAVTPEGLLLKETAPGWSAEEVQSYTEPRLRIAPDLSEIEL